jgi:hypothetical protein
MTEKPDEKRKPPLSYRPPEKLRDEFLRRVKASGLSANAFLTQAWAEKAPPRQSRRPPLEAVLLAKILAQSAQVRDELNRLSAGGAAENSAPIIEAAFEELTAIRAALLLAMGRKP